MAAKGLNEDVTVLKVYQKYESRLITLLASSPVKLANELYSKELIERDVKESALTPALPDRTKTSSILNSFENHLTSSQLCNRRAVLLQFCEVLKEKFSTATSLINEIEAELETCGLPLKSSNGRSPNNQNILIGSQQTQENQNFKGNGTSSTESGLLDGGTDGEILVLLITNTYEDCPNQSYEHLPGVAEDRKNLKNAFSGLSNFRVQADLTNLSSDDLKKAVSIELKSLNNQYRGLIVVFSGHGGKYVCKNATYDATSPSITPLDGQHSFIVANDGNIVQLSNGKEKHGCIHEWALLFDESVNQTYPVPKYFLFDCCRALDSNYDESPPLKGPRDLNITIAWATQDGKKICCPAEGSVWTTELCEQLNTVNNGTNQYTLLHVLKLVKEKMEKNGLDCPQICEKHSKRNYQIYLNKRT